MTPVEANRDCDGEKVESFSTSEGLITYKRRKHQRPGSWSSPRGEPSVSAEEEIMKMPHQTFVCNGNSEISWQARMVPHWRNVLEQLAQSMKDDCILQNCIQRALLCGPLGYSNKLNVKGERKKKDHQKSRYKLQRHSSSPNGALTHNEVSSNELQISANDPADTNTNNSKCQNILFDLLISHKFALLCNLLCENFQGGKVTNIGDLSVIISKMKDGAYERSMDHVVQDIQLHDPQGWEKFQKIGEEMMLLASDLSSISQASCRKQERGCSGRASGEQEFEGVHSDVVKQKISIDSYTKLQLISYGPNCLTKPEKRGASHFDNISTCKQCGCDAHETNRVVCDACEAVYHVLCIKPAIEKIETRSWYCAACVKKRASLEHHLSNDQCDHLHRNGVVWCQLEDSWYQECRRKNPEAVLAVVSSGERQVQNIESNKSPEPSKAATVVPLCKQCGSCEEDDKLFLICSHSHCLYKYYHIRCLKGTQVASQHQQPNNWYCPSCLCRACLTDKDDELICICDACDEAYHTYCMKPPREKVPDGMWYCYNCERDGKRISGPEH